MRCALLLLGCFASATASADCAEGRVITEQTAGRCCWPDQTWNAERGRCEGPPSCPDGWGAEGDACVRSSLPAPPSAQLLAPPLSLANAGPPAAVLREGSEPIVGLAIAGGVILGVGYLYSIITGTIFLTTGGFCQSNAWSQYIPLVGGFIWAGIDDDGCPYNSTIGEIMGIPGAGVQIIGTALLIIGLLARRGVQYWDSPEGPVRVGTGPGDVGLSLIWSL